MQRMLSLPLEIPFVDVRSGAGAHAPPHHRWVEGEGAETALDGGEYHAGRRRGAMGTREQILEPTTPYLVKKV